MNFLDPKIQRRVQQWLDGPYDAETKNEIRRLLSEDPKKLADAFFKDLSFGTGGMRGLMGIGTNRMNLYTIEKATQGLANYLKKQNGKGPVFIGYDTRLHSHSFAKRAAQVLAGNGIPVLISQEICPTPLVSFACRHYQCSAAIMITASHNPPEYNGYKVYWNDGAQVVSPHDQGIIEQVALVNEVSLADVDSPLIRSVGSELDDFYLQKLKKQQLHPELKGHSLQIIYSNLHGTGLRLIPKALQSWGYASPLLVEKQKTLDGKFPFAHSPNPEEAEALKLGTEQLVSTQSDLFIATDPDADRMGIVIRDHHTTYRLTGNQIGCLCLHHICQTLKNQGTFPPHATFVKTIVTTELFKAIAESFGGRCVDVLTGFKYIAEQIRLWENSSTHYLFGAEESYGYLFGTFVRDKDAISATCLIAEAAALAKKEGITLLTRLHQIYHQYGIHRESLQNISFTDSQAGMEEMSALMNRLRKSPPKEIGGSLVIKIEDYLEPTPLPRSDVLRFWLQDGTKIVTRPSGTEPKVKIYVEVVEKETQKIEEAISIADAKLKKINDSFLSGSFSK